MQYFIIKCLLSGLIIAVISEVARRSPTLGTGSNTNIAASYDS